MLISFSELCLLWIVLWKVIVINLALNELNRCFVVAIRFESMIEIARCLESASVSIEKAWSFYDMLHYNKSYCLVAPT